jgi:hypothetical protein
MPFDAPGLEVRVLDVFTLLVFEGTDSVAEVRTIRAEGVAQARRMVETLMRTKPAAAGHQLWRDGVCLSRTYPSASGVSPAYVDPELYQSRETDGSDESAAAAFVPAQERARSTVE